MCILLMFKLHLELFEFHQLCTLTMKITRWSEKYQQNDYHNNGTDFDNFRYFMYAEFVLLAGNNLYRKWVVVVSHMGKHNDLWVRPCQSIHPFVQTYVVIIIMYVINLFSQNCFIFFADFLYVVKEL